MHFVKVEVILGEVQTELKCLASEETCGSGGRTYLYVRWQVQGICFIPSVNLTRSTLQNLSQTVLSAVLVLKRFPEHDSLIARKACIPYICHARLLKS